MSEYLHILENFNDIIWRIDISTGRFTYISPSVTSILGYTVEEALEGIFDDNPNNNESYRTTQKAIVQEINHLLQSGKEYSDMVFEYQMPDKKGIQIWVETEIRILKEDGYPKEILGITRNIEDRKKVADLMLAHANELEKINKQKDLFLKVLAHDLRSPFNSLLGFSDFLISSIDDSSIDEVKKYSKAINLKLHTTLDLLDEILIWIQHQSNNLILDVQEVFFQDMCKEILEKISFNFKNIKIDCYETERFRLKTDINILKVILRNLISNALKFSHLNGIVKVYAYKTMDGITITVSDKGVGMDEKQVASLWEQAYSSKGTSGEKGFGLGLSFCKELVGKLNGEISVKSKPGLGSDFNVTLPLDCISYNSEAAVL